MSETSNKTGWFILGGLVALVIVYFIFRERINRLLGIAINYISPSWASCGGSFFVKLDDGTTQAIWNSNNGTEQAPDWKFYKKGVTFTQDGVINPGSAIEITKEDYQGFCKYKYNPPYEWYTKEGGVTGATGHKK